MIWHFVCFGPIDPFSGLIYEVERERFLVSSDGRQSDDSRSIVSNVVKVTLTHPLVSDRQP
jgi:uncharacterized protein YndB with AHSA1/START domain